MKSILRPLLFFLLAYFPLTSPTIAESAIPNFPNPDLARPAFPSLDEVQQVGYSLGFVLGAVHSPSWSGNTDAKQIRDRYANIYFSSIEKYLAHIKSVGNGTDSRQTFDSKYKEGYSAGKKYASDTYTRAGGSLAYKYQLVKAFLEREGHLKGVENFVSKYASHMGALEDRQREKDKEPKKTDGWWDYFWGFFAYFDYTPKNYTDKSDL